MTRRQRDLERLAREHGWTVERTRRHWRLVSPDGHRVIVAATPSDSGWQRVISGCLKRAERRQEAAP